MTIIHIETSTSVCSVAASKNGKCIFKIDNADGLNHATMLSPFIEQALEALRAAKLSPDAIAVSGGPGSYTGLRIGVSTAKGLCFGFGIPLIAIDTLHIIVENALQNSIIKELDAKNTLLCPMIDARRMEVYAALYNMDSELISPVEARIIDENSFNEILSEQEILFFGNGAEKCSRVITCPSAKFISNVFPLAEDMIRLAETKFRMKDFVDLAYYEPFYLKEFQTTLPKKDIINT